MALSNDLISQFVKATQDKPETNKESTAYGTIVVSDGKEYVKLDGSDLLTPISSTTVVHDGDRVIVTIKNHTAVVTGDLTNPSASDTDVQNIDKEVKEIGTQVSQFEQIVADKVSTSQLQAQIARIDELETETAKIETLETKVAKIDDLEADVAKIDDLEADIAKIDTLEADIATFKSTTTESLNTVNATINNLDTTYATIDKLEATNATIAELNAKKLDTETATATYATIQNLNSANAEINNLKTDKLDATEANAKYATIENLNSSNAEIDNLKTNKLDAESAKVIFADIDFSNITQAAIQELFTESGIIKDLVMKDGSVTGELVGVTIKGDLVEAGTLKADKLVIRDSKDGLYYKLNFDAGTFKEGEAIPENGLHGSVIVAKSVTAEKVAVTDLVAFGATIGGFNITNNAIYSGAKGGVTSTAAGIYQDKEGQFAVGDGTNFVKFYKDQNGKYKLEIAADSLTFGSEKKTIESLYEEVAANSEAVKNNTDDLTEYISKTNASLSNLQGQIDGAIMTHFKEYAPLPSKDDKTSANSPAKEWIEADASINKNDQKNNHLGDLFYNTIKGYCYRWQVLNNQYFWELVKDVDVTKALADAAKAQDTADGKRRVFVETPTPPYDVGDLWSQGSTGDLMRCKTTKTKDQSYAVTDWEKSSKYTDDAKANEVADNLVKAEIRITQNANAIELRATKEEVTNQVNTINNNLASNYYNKTQTDAKIKVEADKIALQATKIEETNTKIDNLEIGGRNLVPNSEWVSTITITDVGETPNWSWGKNPQRVDVINGETYTLTAYYNNIRMTDAWYGYAYAYAYKSDGTRATSNDYMWTSVTGGASTVTINNSDIAYLLIQLGIRNCSKGDVYRVKLEKGNKYTDWSPAPEDTQADIDSINTNLSTNYYTKTESDAKLQVESDRITSTVSKLSTVETTANTAKSTADTAKTTATNAATTAGEAKTAASNAQSTANTAKSTADTAKSTADTAKANVTTLTTRVTSAETKIDQNADAIALRATKTEVTEQINKINVGGRNLILNSGEFEDKDNWVTNGATVLEVVEEDARKCIHAIGSIRYNPSCLVKFDTEYVYHMYAKFDRNATIGSANPLHYHAWAYDSITTGRPDGNVWILETIEYYVDTPGNTNIIANTWHHIVLRFHTRTQEQTGKQYALFKPYLYGTPVSGSEGNGEYWMNWIKLEEGNKPSDWSPAPEDIENELTTNYYTKTQTDAQIKVASDSINLTVSSVKTTADNAAKAASDASTAATEAKNSATTANNNANTAITTANTANATANAASTTATTASNTATAAKNTANDASTAATTATTAANNAAKAASDAATAAKNAKDAADAAQEDIDNLEIGGRNIVLNSDFYATNDTVTTQQFPLVMEEYNNLRKKIFVISVDIELNNAVANTSSSYTGHKRVGTELSIKYTDGTTQYCGVWQQLNETAQTIKSRFHNVIYTQDKDVEQLETKNVGIYIQGLGSGTAKVGRVKIELGNKPTDWTPAPEDVDADIQKVDDGVNDLITDLSTNYYTKLQTDSAISIESNSIKQHVSETYSTKNDTEALSKIVETKMDSESFNIAITKKLEEDGVTTFKTTTGFTFGENGLDITKTGAATSTNIDENGMDIIRSSDNEKVLVADEDGVTAFNLWAKTYLIIGETSRLEDYTKNSKKRTGCFWIGE